MRYFIYFSYKGTAYHGWQYQPNALTVQAVLEDAFSLILRERVPLTAAGRTDTGVHAVQMVAHFDYDFSQKDLSNFIYRLNNLLPYDVAVEKIVPVSDDAHARFSAISRTYHYYVCTSKNAFYTMLCTRVPHTLDFAKMNDAAAVLLQTQDFASFCKAHTDVKTTFCKVTQAQWTEQVPGIWMFEITADRFLRNMVRAIVGTLFAVGKGKISKEEFERIINLRQREAAGDSAPAEGLYLYKVEYPKEIFA